MKTVLGLKPSLVRWLPQCSMVGTLYFERIPDGLQVFESCESYGSEDWLHVSASFENRLPSWEDMREVKEAFCGKGREAYMVLPPQERYINDHPYVLHLWCPIGGPVLPDFRKMGPFGRMTI